MVTLVVLGVIALLVLRLTSGTPTAPGDLDAPNAAAVTACRADVAVITAAADNYRTLNGHEPPAGSAWATGPSDGGPFVQSWPGQRHVFSLSWTGTGVTVATPHGAGCAHA